MEGNGNAGSWSKDMLQLAIENTLYQWVEEFTRLWKEEELSLLDLVFTKKTELRPIIKCLSPVGKSDHVLIEMEPQKWAWVRIEENYKNERLNYARGNFEVRKFF